MSESNNVRFIEDNGKWAWKRYDADGSVIYRSPLFDTEREAREDYDLNGTPSETSAHNQSLLLLKAPNQNQLLKIPLLPKQLSL